MTATVDYQYTAERDARYLRELEAAAVANGIDLAESVETVTEQLTTAAPKAYHRTDVGNAQRLIDLHGDEVRFRYGSATGGIWHVWDGQRWAEDRTGEVERRAKDAVKAIYADALRLDDDERTKLMKWALASESVGRLKAMAEAARSDRRVVITLEDLDADRWALNVRNGTVDLRTGTLRAHDPAELHAKIAAAGLPEGDWRELAPAWRTFLERVLPDGEVRAYVQRLAGYTLTGDIGQNVLPICSGTGANGKSVFLGVLAEVMGDYATTAAPGLLEQRRERGIPADLADLRGYRFAVASEVEPGRSMAVEVMKQVTGEQTLKSRKLYKDFESYDNVTTLWMAANDLPQVNGLDEAIFRRIRRIPFDVVIPPAERDPQLHHKLTAERDGILRWMVDGLVRYHEQGLETPDAVKVATASYQAESNPLADWFDADCELDPDGKARSADLRKSYEDYCRVFRATPIPKNSPKWAEGLTQLGCIAPSDGRVYVGGKQARGWLGVKLRRESGGSGGLDL